MNWAKSWARLQFHPPEEVLGSWDWFWPWFDKIQEKVVDIIYPCCAAAAAAFLGAVLSFLIHSSRWAGKPDYALWLLPAPPLLGLAFWFFTAPHPRFAMAFFFLLPISTAYPLLQLARFRWKL
jgi:hypothetical protein